MSEAPSGPSAGCTDLTIGGGDHGKTLAPTVPSPPGVEVTDLTIGVGDDTKAPAPAISSSLAPGKTPLQVQFATPINTTHPAPVLPDSSSNSLPDSSSISTGASVSSRRKGKKKKQKRKTTGGMAPSGPSIRLGDDTFDIPVTAATRDNVAMYNARILRMQRMMDAECSALEKSIFACGKCSSVQQKLDEQTRSNVELTRRNVELTELLAAKTAEAKVCSEALRKHEAKRDLIKAMSMRLKKKSSI